jgi:hypothetical protein
MNFWNPDKFAAVETDSAGQLYLSIRGEQAPTQHVKLEKEAGEKCSNYVGLECTGTALLDITCAVSVESGDVVLEFDFELPGRSFLPWDRWPSRRNCLLLRQTSGEYYQIISRVVIEGASEFCDKECCPTSRKMYGFRLGLDAGDVVDYFISAIEDDAKYSVLQADTPSYGGYGAIQRPFTCRTFSSYAFKAQPSPSTDPNQVWKAVLGDNSLGTPSVDGKSIPCAACGGLLYPTERT